MVNLYTLEHPLTGEIRYVGKTIASLSYRLGGHLKSAKVERSSCHNTNWIKSLLKQNLKPVIRLYDIVDDKVWDDEEKLMIAQLRNWGFNLTNQQLGGSHSHLVNLPDYHKKNISKGLLLSEKYKNGIANRSYNGDKNPFFGKNHNNETINSISLTKSSGQVAIYDKNDKVICIFTSATKLAKELKIHKQTILKRTKNNMKLQLNNNTYVAKYESI